MLRLTLFATLLGAVLTVLAAWMLARQNALQGGEPALANLYHVVVPLLAVVALAGALLLERIPVLGMLLLISGCGLGIAWGGIWLLPGTAVGTVWAARKRVAARFTLGFLLLIPGVAAGFYGAFGTLSYASAIPVGGLPPGLANPLSLRQALAPLELLPVAWLGAWLLLGRANN